MENVYFLAVRDDDYGSPTAHATLRGAWNAGIDAALDELGAGARRSDLRWVDHLDVAPRWWELRDDYPDTDPEVYATITEIPVLP